MLVEKDLGRAISLFWSAINAGDRVDNSLKNMAMVMKQMNRSDEAIEVIKSFRHLSTPESQESIDNNLFKQSGRIEEEIDLLQHKLKQVEEGMAFSGRKTKIARSQGKKIQITVQKEYSRLLGNLAWAYMSSNDFLRGRIQLHVAAHGMLQADLASNNFRASSLSAKRPWRRLGGADEEEAELTSSTAESESKDEFAIGWHGYNQIQVLDVLKKNLNELLFVLYKFVPNKRI